jgi:flagellar basal-body rod protein FlgC
MMNFLIFLIVFFLQYVALAEDSLKGAIEVASHGALFQAERLKIVTENIANAKTTSDSPGGNPYRRKVIIAQNVYNPKIKSHVITTKKITTDKSDFIMEYAPSHPAANSDGYVKYPNIHKEIERVDASEAQRSFEANINIIEMTNSMRQKTIEAMR